MKDKDKDKAIRVLDIYNKLKNGKVVYKPYEANKYNVQERTIQRDIDTIRDYLENTEDDNGILNSIVYDRKLKGYYMEKEYKKNMQKLSNSELLAICKILLDSRAFVKDEMESILSKLINCCLDESGQEIIKEMIANEKYHYIELQHKTQFLDTLWQIGQAIKEQRYIEISYIRTKDKKLVNRKLRPAAIMFSEFYFYVVAFIDDKEVKKNFEVIDDAFPTIYRIDRIKGLSVSDEKFKVIYSTRFEEGEFRKRIQFMYGGRLKRIKFKYSGCSIESILDRLPTAKILAEEGGIYTVSAEVFGDGIDMWIRSQGNLIEIINN